MGKNKKLILILLIAFVIVTTGALLLIKMKDLGYFGKKSETIVKTGQGEATKIFTYSGIIMNVDKDKKSILTKSFNADRKEWKDLAFLINKDTEIILSSNKEKLSFDDLLIGDSIGIGAIEDSRGNWTAKKIQITDGGVLSAKVVTVEKNKLAVSKNFGNNQAVEMLYGILITPETKFIIKDYAKITADAKAGRSLDINSVAEKNGTIADVKKDSNVLIYAKDGSIPRKAGDFEASKIEIILNNQ